jgi:hypothetical protein
MYTTFGFQLRILLCTHCGAPLEASPTGSQIPCRKWQATRKELRGTANLFTVTMPGYPQMLTS